jgi:hypothetical protein
MSSEVLSMRNMMNSNEADMVKQVTKISVIPFEIKKEKRYLVECPFLDPRDNEVSLNMCRGCYWNNGVIDNLDGIPVKVKCQYMYHPDFIVQVTSDYHGK